MKPLAETLRSWFAAVAYAEAGEYETAKAMAGVQPREAWSTTTVLDAFQRVFVASSFAEEGLHREAASYLEIEPATHIFATECFLNAVGLDGIRVQYVLARI